MATKKKKAPEDLKIVTVRALKVAYYGERLLQPGDVFVFQQTEFEEECPEWGELVGEASEADIAAAGEDKSLTATDTNRSQTVL